MDDNLFHIVLAIVTSVGTLAGLLVLMTFLEPEKSWPEAAGLDRSPTSVAMGVTPRAP